KLNQTGVMLTPPYYDDYVHQNMITMSRALHHPKTGEFLGCAGADMSIRIIEDDVRAFKYLDGRSLLFDIGSGLVIADSNGVSTSLILYNQTANPSITNDVWNTITA